MIYTTYTISQYDCYLNQPYLSLNMVGSFIMMLIYLISILVFFILFLFQTSYNHVVYYGLVCLEQKLLKAPLQMWWILAVPFLFYGVFVKLVLDDTFCSTNLVSCAPLEFKLTHPLTEIPSFGLGSFKKNNLAQWASLNVVSKEGGDPYNLVMSQLNLIHEFLNHLDGTCAVLQQDYVMRAKLLSSHHPDASDAVNRLKNLYFRHVWARFNLFNLTSLDACSVTLETSPGSFVYNHYSSGLLSFFKKLSDFHLALIEFPLITKSDVLGYMVFPYDLYEKGLNQGDCIKVLKTLSPWKEQCATYLNSLKIDLRKLEIDYSNIYSLLDPCIVNQNAGVVNDKIYSFLQQIRYQCLNWSLFYDPQNIDPSVWKPFYSVQFFKKHALSFLIEQDMFVYSWLRVEQLTELDSNFNLDLENRVLSSTVGENYFKVVRGRMPLASLSCNLQNKDSIDVGISKISDFGSEAKICCKAGSVQINVSGTASPRTWVGFFYDLFNFSAWLPDKNLTVTAVDKTDALFTKEFLNSKVSSSVEITEKPTPAKRTWSMFLYQVFTLKIFYN